MALFGTSLVPISGYFGWIYGMLAAIINSAVVLNLSILHGGMNLYNTGFSSGIVAAFLIPILNAFVKKSPESDSQDVTVQYGNDPTDPT